MGLRRTLTAAVVAVLAIAWAAACASAPPDANSGPLAASSPSVVSRGLYGAEAAYAGAGALLEALLDAGAVPPERARQLRELERRAWAALQVARAADAAGDSTAAKLQAGVVLTLVLQMREGR